jgi:hypothetical protein
MRDRTMVGCMAAGLVGPVLLGALMLLAAPEGWDPPLREVPAHVAAIATIAVFAVMTASSCVDWYLIRPFRDGVLGPPVCQMHEYDNETALYYAHAWIAHRAVAELFGWGGSAIVLIVALVAVQQSTNDPVWAEIFTYLAPAGAVYLGIGGHLAKRLRPVPNYVQEPSPGLGRWATGTIIDDAGGSRTIDGFVVDVALGKGLQVLSDGEVGNRSRQFVPLGDSSELNLSHRPLCLKHCERWIPHCERGLCEDQADKPPAREAGLPVNTPQLRDATPGPGSPSP